MPLEIVLEGILIVLSQGCKWRAINRPEAAWNSVYQYYRTFIRNSVFKKLFSGMNLPLKGKRRFLDSTCVKVHRCAMNPPGGGPQAMGRTKGGMNTKIHAVVDEAGLPVRLLISPGNDGDITHAPEMIEGLSAEAIVADKGYDSDDFVRQIESEAAKACIPPRSNRLNPRKYSKATYKKRHLVENFFEKIKNFRRVATRYDKLAETFLGFVCLAAVLVSLPK